LWDTLLSGGQTLWCPLYLSIWVRNQERKGQVSEFKLFRVKHESSVIFFLILKIKIQGAKLPHILPF